MPSGTTTTLELADSLEETIASIRARRDQAAVMTNLCDHETLEEGSGLYWSELTVERVTAMYVNQATDMSLNAQQLSDTKLQIQPTMIGVAVLLPWLVQHRINSKVLAQTGTVMQGAAERLKNADGLTLLDSGTSLGGTGSIMSFSLVAAAVSRIEGNTTDEVDPPYFCVIVPNQRYPIAAELTSGVGTYPIPSGMTEEVYRNSFQGKIAGAEVYTDKHITIDGSNDAKGGVFAKSSLLIVQATKPRTIRKDKEELGGNSLLLINYDDYGWGVRHGAGVGLFELYTNASNPTG